MFKIYVVNLGKYNEGELVGKWLDLPAREEEIEELMIRIGVAHRDEDGEYVPYVEENGVVYEETAIYDYDVDIEGLTISEWEDIEELSELAERCEALAEDQKLAVRACLQNGSDFEEALDTAESGDFIVYYNCDDMEDVAMQFIDESGLLEDAPAICQEYFDYEAYGRDLELEGTFIEVDDVFVELLR